jgi:hypothetical protein
MISKGILFGETHSYYDLNLILSKTEIPPAEPKLNYIDIPGSDGSKDLTEAHGEVKYSDRNCKFTFSLLPSESVSWEEKKTEISNLLNGKSFKITLDKDEDYYYQGRCKVNSYVSNKNLKQVVIDARVQPYKYKQHITVITATLTATPTTLNLINGRKKVSPLIECTDDNTTVIFGDASYKFNTGTHKILDIQLSEGNNAVMVSGTGTITFKYQEGEL